MATTEEKILIDFVVKTDQMKKELTDSSNLVKSLGNNFEDTGKKLAKSTIEGSKGMQALEAQTEKTGEAIRKAFKVEQLGKLEAQLKATNEQLTKVSTTGKLFKALDADAAKLTNEIAKTNKEIKNLTAEAPTLKAQYKSAMIDVQNGVEGAAERAGQLKDQIDDANEAVGNLASGSKIEQFNSQLGTVGTKLSNLDFEGAADAAKQLGEIASKISIKETLGQLKNLGSVGLNAISSLISPTGLLVAGIAAVGYAIYSVITAEDEEITKMKEAIKIQELKSRIAISGLNREIELLKAAGESSTEKERELREETIKSAKLKFELASKVYFAEREFAIRILAGIHGRAEAIKMLNKKEIEGSNEKFNALLDAAESLKDAENALEVDKRAKTKTFGDALVAGAKVDVEKIKEITKNAAEKAKSDREKEIELRKKQNELYAKAEEEALTAPIRKVFEERKRTLEEEKEIIEGFGEQFQTAVIEDYDFNLKLLQDSLLFERGAYEQKQKMLDDALAAKKISQEQYDAEVQEAREEDIKKELEAFNKKVEIANQLFNIASDINGAINQIQENQLREGDKLSISQQQAQFNRNKALGLVNVGINTAEGISKAVAQSPLTFGLPFSAFVLLTGGLQAAAIAGKNFTPQGFAEGTPLVKGGVKGKDSVHALLMPDERVVTAKDNAEYWSPLESIRMGNFDKEYVRTADLMAAHEQIKQNEQESFANNIAYSLALNGNWKGQNIDRRLKEMSNDEIKMHRELIATIKQTKISARKK